MDPEIKETPYYVCPNGCEDPMFYIDGDLRITRFFTEEGEIVEDKTYDFDPNTNIACRKCHSVAIKKTKKVTTTIVIE